MPRLVLALTVVASVALAVLVAGPAASQPGAPAPARPAPVPAPPAAGDPAVAPLALPNGEPAVVVPLPPLPTSRMPERPQLVYGPSGFWTSDLPSRGGAYRWRIMAAGALVLAITIFFVVRLVRRTSRARASS